jgi:hypothetical protein
LRLPTEEQRLWTVIKVEPAQDRGHLTMAKRKQSSKSSFSGGAQTAQASGLLDKLTAEEAATVLRHLLDKHPELASEAQRFATKLVSSSSIEDIAQDVFDRISNVDLDDLNGRAGAHSWGYVEPGEAAGELLEESVDDLVEDMKRKAELGLVSDAEVVCAGIVEGLHQARNIDSDGALGWAPDFPGEHADFVVAEFFRACRPQTRKAAQKSLMDILAKRVPGWAEDLKRAMERGIAE